MLMLKLPYFGHLMGRSNSLVKTLMLGKIEGRRRRGQQRMRWLDGITDSMTWVWASSERWWRTGKPGVLQFLGSCIDLEVAEWLKNNNEIRSYAHLWKLESRGCTYSESLQLWWGQLPPKPWAVRKGWDTQTTLRFIVKSQRHAGNNHSVHLGG